MRRNRALAAMSPSFAITSSGARRASVTSHRIQSGTEKHRSLRRPRREVRGGLGTLPANSLGRNQRRVMRQTGLTGERPMQGSTPDALLALHDAGYREVIARLPAGTVI